MDPNTLPWLLTVKQISELTGVPPRTIYTRIKEGAFGDLPEAGRYKKVPKQRVLDWAQIEVPA